MNAIADLFPTDAPAGVDPVAHIAAVLARARFSAAARGLLPLVLHRRRSLRPPRPRRRGAAA